MSSSIGFGAPHSRVKLYIANRPDIDDYPGMQQLRGMVIGEINHIVKNTSNHWRKVFNVYAKLLFDWYSRQTKQDLPGTWQEYRDRVLFQSHSEEALLFTAPVPDCEDHSVHIIAGKTYASQLILPPLTWLDKDFAINQQSRLIISPYPDYRQLSNEKIARLIELMTSFNK